MERFRVYGARTAEESLQEKENRALARAAAAEGMVLLKNEGVLPLKEKRLALYGAGARMTVRGGTGSGDVNERYSVSIEQGLRGAGYEIANTKWLDRFDESYRANAETYRNRIEEKVKGYTMDRVMEMFEVIQSQPQMGFPVGGRIQEEDIDGDAECAVYVMARQAGEGGDRQTEPGDFLPDDTEVYNLYLLAERYQKVLLVINCGGIIDLSFADGIQEIGAILYYGQGGTEGGNAFADLVSGKVTPSGKLADTWAKRYEDYPCAESYSYKNGNLEEEDYREGIYVGYRYFDTFRVKPRYEFGYGLSYTDFSWGNVQCRVEQETFCISAEIKNTGNYDGREVLQAYVKKPWGRLDHEAKGLAAFVKTDTLSPGEIRKVDMRFGIRELESFDDKREEWFLESGEYIVFLGNSSKNTVPVAILAVEEEFVLEKTEAICRRDYSFEVMIPQEDTGHLIQSAFPERPAMMSLKDEVYSSCAAYSEKPTVIFSKNRDYLADTEKTEKDTVLPRFILGTGNLSCVRHSYEKPKSSTTDKVRNLRDKLTREELAKLCVGGGFFGKMFHITPGAVGRTTSDLVAKGIPNINLSDGPAGLNLNKETVVEKDGTVKYLNRVPENIRWGCIREIEAEALGDSHTGIPVYQYYTAWPAAQLLAQTWNPKLLETIGRGVAEEMYQAGVSLWLAPGMNIHRNPLCGRNFEYYSEDPYLSGKMASAVAKGVQSLFGVGVTVKHFCCNNQESNRMAVSENVSERALREIYLRGFRYVVEEARPKALMSSYNRVNGCYVVNSYDLLTKVLRNEWGYDGLVMSDWGATGEGRGSHTEAIRAGNDLIMPGSPDITMALVQALEEGQLEEEEISLCASRVLNTIFDCFTSEGF